MTFTLITVTQSFWHDCVVWEWNKREAISQQRRGCWCVCGQRRAELHRGDPGEHVLNVKGHWVCQGVWEAAPTSSLWTVQWRITDCGLRLALLYFCIWGKKVTLINQWLNAPPGQACQVTQIKRTHNVGVTDRCMLGLANMLACSWWIFRVVSAFTEELLPSGRLFEALLMFATVNLCHSRDCRASFSSKCLKTLWGVQRLVILRRLWRTSRCAAFRQVSTTTYSLWLLITQRGTSMLPGNVAVCVCVCVCVRAHFTLCKNCAAVFLLWYVCLWLRPLWSLCCLHVCDVYFSDVSFCCWFCKEWLIA